ncbi:MAG: NRDE family protein [Steroidobacteraceae bacterium]
MCLLVLAWQAHPRYRLVVAANRDEFHERRAAPLHEWSAAPGGLGGGVPGILGGRDLRAGGTWLALDRSRRFGVVTNYRDLQQPAPGAPSRGRLIPDYLTQTGGAREFLAALAPAAEQYSGFNLLLTDDDGLWYASNRATPFARALPPGVYGLSNHLLDTPWPKLQRARRAFQTWLDASPVPGADGLLALLGDRTPAEAHERLPETGLSPEWERVLSSTFVLHPQYGTRCSTVVMLEPGGAILVRERRYDAAGAVSGETEVELRRDEWR